MADSALKDVKGFNIPGPSIDIFDEMTKNTMLSLTDNTVLVMGSNDLNKVSFRYLVHDTDDGQLVNSISDTVTYSATTGESFSNGISMAKVSDTKAIAFVKSSAGIGQVKAFYVDVSSGEPVLSDVTVFTDSSNEIRQVVGSIQVDTNRVCLMFVTYTNPNYYDKIVMVDTSVDPIVFGTSVSVFISSSLLTPGNNHLEKLTASLVMTIFYDGTTSVVRHKAATISDMTITAVSAVEGQWSVINHNTMAFGFGMVRYSDTQCAAFIRDSDGRIRGVPLTVTGTVISAGTVQQSTSTAFNYIRGYSKYSDSYAVLVVDSSANMNHATVNLISGYAVMGSTVGTTPTYKHFGYMNSSYTASVLVNGDTFVSVGYSTIYGKSILSGYQLSGYESIKTQRPMGVVVHKVPTGFDTELATVIFTGPFKRFDFSSTDNTAAFLYANKIGQEVIRAERSTFVGMVPVHMGMAPIIFEADEKIIAAGEYGVSLYSLTLSGVLRDVTP